MAINTIDFFFFFFFFFFDENYIQTFGTLKITLKNSKKDGFTKNYTEKMPLLFRNLKKVKQNKTKQNKNVNLP